MTTSGMTHSWRTMHGHAPESHWRSKALNFIFRTVLFILPAPHQLHDDFNRSLYDGLNFGEIDIETTRTDDELSGVKLKTKIFGKDGQVHLSRQFAFRGGEPDFHSHSGSDKRSTKFKCEPHAGVWFPWFPSLSWYAAMGVVYALIILIISFPVMVVWIVARGTLPSC